MIDVYYFMDDKWVYSSRLKEEILLDETGTVRDYHELYLLICSPLSTSDRNYEYLREKYPEEFI